MSVFGGFSSLLLLRAFGGSFISLRVVLESIAVMRGVGWLG